MAYDFLKEQHPTYKANVDEWTRRERLLRGGPDVIDEELEIFEWEEAGGTHYANRKKQAVYPAFGEAFVRTMVGHVLRDRPEPGEGLYFGGLGEVERSEGQTQPSRAEQVYFNVNGTGGDGQQFWQWVAAVFQRAGGPGMRWAMVEAPPWRRETPPSVADELRGFRPYAVELSPRLVTNWRIENGRLQWCVVRITNDTRRVENGQITGKVNEPGYYLLVRQGVEELGAEFAGGGWWKFGENAQPIPDAKGTWLRTQGEIPMAFAIWEWEDVGAVDDDGVPLPIGRSGTTALDNLSVAYMNAKSAWRSNMWRAAGGPTFVLGVDSEAWKVVVEQWNSGVSLLGVPPSRDGSSAPTVAHSAAAAVSSEAFKALLEDMTAEAERMMIQMATSTPDSSGRSKEAGFAETKAPRLTLLAENIESFVNTILRFFELRFGITNPSAYVEMPREFDLAPVEEDIREFFETFALSELRSVTLESQAMLALAEAKGLVNDENRDTVESELRDSAAGGAAAVSQEEAQDDEIDRVLAGTAAGGGA